MSPISPGPNVHGFRRRVTSIFPQNDDFTENATPYGDKLASYIRLRPWSTAGDTATGYPIPVAKGDLHAGYFGTAGGNVYRPGLQFASFKAQSGTGTNENFCSLLWRQGYIARTRVTLAFRMLAVTGTVPSTSFRWVGVTARNAGGTFDNTAQVQDCRDNTGYWFILANKVGHAGGDAMWLLLRVNAGATTLLASASTALAAQAVADSLTGTKAIELTVDDSAGNPVLTAKYEGVTVLTFTDTSGSKITAAGRGGFGMCRDRQEAGSVNSAHVAAWWEMFDIAANGSLVRDSFDRVNLQATPTVTDGNAITGRMLTSMWSLDIYGRTTFATGGGQNRLAGQDRIQTTTGGLDMFSQIAANDLYTQSRSVVFNLANPAGNPKPTGIYLRAAWNPVTGQCTKGYRARLYQDGIFSRMFVERIDGEATFAILCAKIVTTGWGLVYGTDYTVKLSIANLGGTGPSNGTPSITVYINGTQVTGWTGMPSGVTIGVGGNVLDGQTNAILEGSGNGLLLDTNAFTCQYDTWTDEIISPTDPGEDDHDTIDTGDECDGKTGTFTIPFDWPYEITVYRRHNERRYETGHVNRILRSKKDRRTWRISANAITFLERAQLIAFWNQHGVAIPFDFPDPEKPSVLVCAHFKDDQLGTVLRNPGVNSFTIEIEELLEPT